jgi:hypothetical protein
MGFLAGALFAAVLAFCLFAFAQRPVAPREPDPQPQRQPSPVYPHLPPNGATGAKI